MNTDTIKTLLAEHNWIELFAYLSVQNMLKNRDLHSQILQQTECATSAYIVKLINFHVDRKWEQAKALCDFLKPFNPRVEDIFADVIQSLTK